MTAHGIFLAMSRVFRELYSASTLATSSSGQASGATASGIREWRVGFLTVCDKLEPKGPGHFGNSDCDNTLLAFRKLLARTKLNSLNSFSCGRHICSKPKDAQKMPKSAQPGDELDEIDFMFPGLSLFYLLYFCFSSK